MSDEVKELYQWYATVTRGKEKFDLYEQVEGWRTDRVASAVFLTPPHVPQKGYNLTDAEFDMLPEPWKTRLQLAQLIHFEESEVQEKVKAARHTFADNDGWFWFDPNP